jgi:hypothetical protein
VSLNAIATKRSVSVQLEKQPNDAVWKYDKLHIFQQLGNFDPGLKN